MNEALVTGLLAHVDSGKTTLAEAILYTCGVKRELGRVDHKDTFLDDLEIERQRGITVVAKQAKVTFDGVDITLLDTPGHSDFCAEMERTLQVMDMAVLLISASDKVTGHTLTLWKLLRSYNIPTVIFINKTDMPGVNRSAIFENCKRELTENIVDFSCFYTGDENEAFYDALAMCDEELMEEFLGKEKIGMESIRKAFLNRKVFPLIYGSALNLDGVDELLKCLKDMNVKRSYPEGFDARVFKISRDSDGRKLTHVRITGGELKVRDKIGDEKVDSIRIYNGSGFENVQKVTAGQICTLVGLENSFTGMSLGQEDEKVKPLLAPVLTYRVITDEREDAATCLKHLKMLEQEQPELNVSWQESTGEIHISVMGDVQIQILKSLYHDRFDKYISVGEGSILYKETIASAVEGIGHYEPLRHYSEVHVLLTPLPAGSGIEYDANVSVDELDQNWVRLILTHLKEKQHKGVLTGSPITDIRITVIGGRAHTKHTEGGDFRQSTYRAVRQGLMCAQSILLEPYMDFILRLPTEYVGRAMNDIDKYKGSFEAPVTEGDESVIKGSAPVSTMYNYNKELISYAKGRGSFVVESNDYRPCHNTQEVMEKLGYDPSADLDNLSSSVFCAHGAGYLVEWNEVRAHAHVDCSQKVALLTGNNVSEYEDAQILKPVTGISPYRSGEMNISLEEIEEIYKNSYHKSSEELTPYRYIGYEKNKNKPKTKEKEYVYKPVEKKESFLLVDGYNIIFASDELSDIAKDNLDGARDALIDICSNYQGSKGMTLILVFDAYKVKGNPGSVQKLNNIYVVYTKEAETADQYIEKTVHVMANRQKCDIMVATSDRLEQMIIYGQGAVRISAREFMADVKAESLRLKQDGYIK